MFLLVSTLTCTDSVRISKTHPRMICVLLLCQPNSRSFAAAVPFLLPLVTAYEKGHQRPALTVYTFQNPDSSGGNPANMSMGPVTTAPTAAADIAQRASSSSIASRPPIPVVRSTLPTHFFLDFQLTLYPRLAEMLVSRTTSAFRWRTVRVEAEPRQHDQTKSVPDSGAYRKG